MDDAVHNTNSRTHAFSIDDDEEEEELVTHDNESSIYITPAINDIQRVKHDGVASTPVEVTSPAVCDEVNSYVKSIPYEGGLSNQHNVILPLNDVDTISVREAADNDSCTIYAPSSQRNISEASINQPLNLIDIDVRAKQEPTTVSEPVAKECVDIVSSPSSKMSACT